MVEKRLLKFRKIKSMKLLPLPSGGESNWEKKYFGTDGIMLFMSLSSVQIFAGAWSSIDKVEQFKHKCMPKGSRE